MLETASITAPIAIRRSVPADGDRLRFLGDLDSRRLPPGPCLVAEIDGQVVAARSLTSSVAVADPFRSTADALALLELRAAQLEAEPELMPRRRRWLRRLAAA